MPAVRKKKVKDMGLKVFLLDTEEKFRLGMVSADMQVSALKASAELASGIPSDLQVLTYLDESDMKDTTTVKQNEIVPNATLRLKVWHTWKDLILAAVNNDADSLIEQGIQRGIDFQTPTSEYMMPKERQQWLQKRANVALMIAAHRGHVHLCRKLIEWGADVNATTPLGRTALHFAATEDHGDAINLLLNSGADIDMADQDGKTALHLANEYGNKSCQRHLFMFRWQQRAKNSKPQFLNPPMMEFQVCDSLYPKWKEGPAAQLYVYRLLPPGEFQGSAFHSPKSTWDAEEGTTKNSARRRPILSASGEPLQDEEAIQAERERLYAEWVQKKEKSKKAAELAKKKQYEAEMVEKERKRGSLEQRLKSQHSKNQQQGGGTNSDRNGDEYGPRTSSLPAIASGDYKTRISLLFQRYGIDPSLNAYEQWCKYRATHPHAPIDPFLMNTLGAGNEGFGGRTTGGNRPTYQAMIQEFCHKHL